MWGVSCCHWQVESFRQGVNVGVHRRGVVLGRVGLGLDRVQDGRRDAEVVGQGLRDFGVDEGLGEDRGHALLLGDLADLSQARRGGRGVGVEAGDATWVRPVRSAR